MTRSLCFACLLSLATTSFAAAGGINLSWNDCGNAGVPDMTFACNTNSGAPFRLFASFDPPDTMIGLVANEWVIDLQSPQTATLPLWWSLKGTADPTGRCRDAALVMSTNFAAGPYSCVDPWAGGIAVQGSSYVIGFSGPNTARINGVHALVTEGSNIYPGTEYYSFALSIDRSRTVGVGACTGCSERVCISFSQITLYDYVSRVPLDNPRDRNFVTWQGGTVPGCCFCVPTLNRTWGEVKSLYR